MLEGASHGYADLRQVLYAALFAVALSSHSFDGSFWQRWQWLDVAIDTHGSIREHHAHQRASRRWVAQVVMGRAIREG